MVSKLTLPAKENAVQLKINEIIDNLGGGGSATDVQINGTSITSNDVANIVTNGDYNASDNKIATMSDLPTESTVSGWGFTKNAGTITGIKMNGSSKGTSGVVDLGTVITSHQSLAGYVPTSRTINGKALTSNISLTASDVGALPNSTKYGSTIDVTLSTTDYKQTITLKDQDGNTLSSKIVDFPVESMVVSGTYDSTNKKIVLTLQNGNTTDIPVGDLIAGLQTEITSSNKLSADLISDGTTNKTVTQTEKNTWNGKQNALSTTQINNIAKGGSALQPEDVDTALSTTSENPVQNKIVTDALNDKADDSDVIKKDGGGTSQTIQLSSGTGTTPLTLKSKASSSCYMSYNANGTWVGSLGVNSSKRPTFYNGTTYTLAYTSDIPDISGKQDKITGGASTITSSDLTASRALVSDSNGKVAVSSITSTKLGYLTDVTSNIQAQINNKQSKVTITYDI